MENYVSAIDKYRNAIRYWWVGPLLGVIIFIIGIVALLHPGESYAAMAIIFGLIILLTGIAQLFMGLNMPRHTGRGWLIASGAIEIVLGFILTFNIAVSAMVLPFFLGFWLLFRAMTVIGVAIQMRHEGIHGTGWTIFWAILLIIAAFIVLIYPAVGAGALVIWLGFALMFAGLAMIFAGIQLYRLRNHVDAKV